MLRFAVLIHDHPFLHWDFLLESGRVLRAWRLHQPPDDGLVRAEPLPDHRLVYLDYEGPVSGDRGQVTRWDRGRYELVHERPSFVEVQLHGERLQGRATFVRAGDEDDWTFQFLSGFSATRG